MCHESTSVGAGRGDRHRQGVGQPRGHPPRRADRDRRPEPRHQPPADADRAGEGQEERREDHRDQPAREAGLVRFRNPQKVRGVVGKGTGLADLLPAGPGQRRPRAVPGDRRAAARVGLRRPGVRRASTPPASTSGPSTLRDLDWDAVHRATGLERVADRGGGADVRRLRGDRHLLGDGDHPAPQRRRDGQGDRQRRPAPGQHRQARRRAVPGPRPLQRAGRPHDGHLGASRRSTSSTRCATSSASSRRASTASTPSPRSRPCATARPRSSSAWAATSCPPPPTPR